MSNKSWNISRRTMLRGIGAMIALPHLEIMGQDIGGTTGSTSASSAPRRFISMFIPNGVMPRDWNVKETGTNYKISPILAPLSEMRDDFSIVSGLDNPASGHVKMTGAFLTGVSIGKNGAAVSLDQQIAQKIGSQTRFESLVLGIEPPRQGTAGLPISMASTISWNTPTTRVSPEINPRIAFDRLFRSGQGPEAAKEAQLKKSVIDLVLDDAKSIHRKASYLDKQKIDEYLESIRSVEKRLEKTINPAEASWSPPTKPSLEDFNQPPSGIPRQKDVHLRMMMDIMVLSLWTDTTRVCTLMAAHGFSRQNFTFLNGVRGDHHSISHHKNQSAKLAEYTKVSKWYSEQLAYLMQRLKNIDEGENNLLDNSLILYGSGMKDGNGHIRKDLPIVVAGKANGRFKHKGHVKLKSQPLSNLLHTIGNKFDLDQDNFNKTGSRTIGEFS